MQYFHTSSVGGHNFSCNVRKYQYVKVDAHMTELGLAFARNLEHHVRAASIDHAPKVVLENECSRHGHMVTVKLFVIGYAYVGSTNLPHPCPIGT